MEKYLKYLSFEGRATRSEYWGVYIISYLLLLPVLLVGAVLTMAGMFGSIVGGLLMLAGVVVLTWCILATAARRCRDAGISPWFAGTILIPWLTLIPFIVFGCLKTESKEDEHHY